MARVEVQWLRWHFRVRFCLCDKKNEGPSGPRAEQYVLRSGVDPVIERSLAARTFMAPIPTAETPH